jgi:hypothetical protein
MAFPKRIRAFAFFFATGLSHCRDGLCEIAGSYFAGCNQGEFPGVETAQKRIFSIIW